MYGKSRKLFFDARGGLWGASQALLRACRCLKILVFSRAVTGKIIAQICLKARRPIGFCMIDYTQEGSMQVLAIERRGA